MTAKITELLNINYDIYTLWKRSLLLKSVFMLVNKNIRFMRKYTVSLTLSFFIKDLTSILVREFIKFIEDSLYFIFLELFHSFCILFFWMISSQALLVELVYSVNTSLTSNTLQCVFNSLRSSDEIYHR